MSDWYLKKSNESVYGPVALGTLIHWAADGRIVPEDFISQDQANWDPAPSLGDLAMDWLVTLSDGSQYGPLHLLAVKELIRDGSITIDDMVVHKATREQRKAGDALLEALLSEEALLHDQTVSLMNRVHELEIELEAQRKLAAGRTVDAAAPPPPGESSPWKNLYEEERDSRVKREAELNETIRQLRQSEQAALQQLELTRQKNERIERQAGAPPEPGGATSADAELLSSYNDLASNYDRLLEQLMVKTSELNSLYEQITKSERSADDRITTLEEKVRHAGEEAVTARQRLVQMEKTHLEVVRAYREINDRYIRLKQTGGTLAPPRSSPQPMPPKPPEGNKPKVRLV